jgi:hypothetical protein
MWMAGPRGEEEAGSNTGGGDEKAQAGMESQVLGIAGSVRPMLAADGNSRSALMWSATSLLRSASSAQAELAVLGVWKRSVLRAPSSKPRIVEYDTWASISAQLRHGHPVATCPPFGPGRVPTLAARRELLWQRMAAVNSSRRSCGRSCVSRRWSACRSCSSPSA